MSPCSAPPAACAYPADCAERFLSYAAIPRRATTPFEKDAPRRKECQDALRCLRRRAAARCRDPVLLTPRVHDARAIIFFCACASGASAGQRGKPREACAVRERCAAKMRFMMRARCARPDVRYPAIAAREPFTRRTASRKKGNAAPAPHAGPRLFFSTI